MPVSGKNMGDDVQRAAADIAFQFRARGSAERAADFALQS